MHRVFQNKLLFGVILLTVSATVFSQEQRGDRKYRRFGLHNGNLVETLFWNFGEVAWWGKQPSGVWPRGTGRSYMDGITPIVAAEVRNVRGETIHLVEAGYRENMDISPTGVERGWQPRPGYFNPHQDQIAMSDNPLSWPDHWPNRDRSWDGKWNGYFGQRTNADQESYFVMDDQADDGHDFYPDSTDQTRRGLGLRVEVRGLQWANVLAEDLVFWHYEILNEGTTDYQKAIFGMYVDCGIGGQFDSNDDNAFYDIEVDITYSWDTNGLGEGGWGPTGYAGYAFLESPGNPYNGIDDDGDGEEGSPVVTRADLIGEIPFNGIDDNGNGLVDEAELNIGMKKKDGVDNNGDGRLDEMIDERRDDGIDNNGDWNPARDDVGRDGVAGTGDFGEGDGVPTDGEPNFDKTDKDESDQIGLSAFDVFYIGSGVLFRDDETIWQRISYSHFDTQLQNGNIAFLYGSGPFPLRPHKTERFSLALVFGNDLADIRRNKQIVQKIYNADYNFARPPDKPRAWAVAGDRQVTLYWDDQAERSYDIFSDPPYDFEGYRIYKSTDPGFNDAHIVTDAFGNESFFRPVAQFDIRNEVGGFFSIPFPETGALYYLGDNKGLRHSWTDYDVVNGRTYYYAVVSYDRGDAAKSVFPSECTKIIVRDIAGNLKLDMNTVAVTPNAPAAGYTAPQIEGGGPIHVSGPGTGQVWLDVIDPRQVKEGGRYRVVFDDTSQANRLTYSLYETRPGGGDTLIFEKSSYLQGEDFNPLFDGLRLFVRNDTVRFNPEKSGWIQGKSNWLITGEPLLKFPVRRKGYPASYEVRFGVPDTSWLFNTPQFVTNFQVWNIVDRERVRFYLRESEGSIDSMLSAGEYIDLWIFDAGRWKRLWRVHFIAPPGQEPIPPQAGDVAYLQIDTPFRSGDVFEIGTRGARMDVAAARASLRNIAVVPNPYVAAAEWEPQRLLASGRGERKIDFIHLPPRATIRIYSMSGHLVQTIEHHSTIDDGAASWNLRSRDGMDVAPGVYVYHVEAPDIGEVVGKFAVIK